VSFVKRQKLPLDRGGFPTPLTYDLQFAWMNRNDKRASEKPRLTDTAGHLRP
jgi:hypothetical protein